MPNATPANRTAQRRRSKQRKREYVGAHKMALGCADCGWKPLDGDHSQLDLDHLPEHTKVWDVSNMIGSDWGWKRIKAEMAKCEVVCRPCHIQRTGERQWAAAGLPMPQDLPDPW